MNVPVMVADHALAQAEELEAEARALMVQARSRMAQAADCRLLAAVVEPEKAERTERIG